MWRRFPAKCGLDNRDKPEAHVMSKFRLTRGGFVLLLSGLVAVLLLVYGLQQLNQPREVDLSTLLSDVRSDVAAHKVDTLTLDSGNLTLDRAGGQTERAGVGDGFQLADVLKRDN